MSKLNSGIKACAAILLWAMTAMALPAQTTAIAPTITFTSLYSFAGADGNAPQAVLLQGNNGKLYGTTTYGGTSANGDGTVFSVTVGGTLATLHSFDGADGSLPYGGLVQGANGKFYGTTFSGGANGYGTVFSITTSGTLVTLHSFDNTDGANPSAALVQGTDGKFYGTTQAGGPSGDGTVFSITESGTLTTLHSFVGTDGSLPFGGLVQGTNGKFYGTTYFGASDGCFNGCGSVFSITATGTLATLHVFDGTDGDNPQARLVQAIDGKFYGTTFRGGAECLPYGCGTVFSITAGGMLTVLHSFNGTDGNQSYAGLVQGTDGNFYGATAYGGAIGNNGTLFSITSGGTVTTLHSFDGTDGSSPLYGLVQDTNGNFYGTTVLGGTNGLDGTVFSLSVGLGPFVETNPSAGKAGMAVKILGTNLTGATKVTFHGTPATFTVVSSSEITTTVPVGATSGSVKVITPGGTLSSNVPFQVLP